MTDIALPKYYTLLLADCDKGSNSRVINLVRLDSELNIYDYLTNIYLDYRVTKKSGKFSAFCDRLDDIVRKSKKTDTQIDYNIVYKWIEDDCSEDNFDSILIEEITLVSVKADKYKPNHKPTIVAKTKVVNKSK